jgi:hypothetical protein
MRKNDSSSAGEGVAKGSCSLARASVPHVETSYMQLWATSSGMLLQDSIVCRSPAVVAKECGHPRSCGSANVRGAWRSDNHGSNWSMATDGFPKCFITLGLNAGKESGSLITMMGTGGEHIARCVRKRDVQSTEVDR